MNASAVFLPSHRCPPPHTPLRRPTRAPPHQYGRCVALRDCDMAHLYLRCGSCIFVTWCVLVCDVTHHMCLSHDAFLCVTWLIICVHERCVALQEESKCDVAHSCVPWLVRGCDMTHSYMCTWTVRLFGRSHHAGCVSVCVCLCVWPVLANRLC